jgi:hypothetical protein
MPIVNHSCVIERKLKLGEKEFLQPRRKHARTVSIAGYRKPKRESRPTTRQPLSGVGCAATGVASLAKYRGTSEEPGLGTRQTGVHPTKDMWEL